MAALEGELTQRAAEDQLLSEADESAWAERTRALEAAIAEKDRLAEQVEGALRGAPVRSDGPEASV